MYKKILCILIILFTFSNCAFYNLHKGYMYFSLAQQMYLDEGEAIYEDIVKSHNFINQLNQAVRYSQKSLDKDPKYYKAWWINLESKMIIASIQDNISQTIYLDVLQKSQQLLLVEDNAVKMKACYYLAKSLLGSTIRSKKIYEKVIECSQGKINSLTSMQYIELRDIIESLKNKYVPILNRTYMLKSRIT